MGRYIASRLLQMIPVLFGVSILVFVLMRLIPGDAVELYTGTQIEMTPEQVQQLNEIFGLDEPMHMQFIHWVTDVFRGDLGVSLRTSRPVLDDMLARFPVSLELTLLTLLIAIVIGVPLGILAAVKRNTWYDSLFQLGGLWGLSIPDFWLATLGVLFFSRFVPILQMGTYVPFFVDPVRNLQIMWLPAFTFAVGLAAVLMRHTRASVVEVLRSDYVRTAQAKGLANGRVVGLHVLRNAFIPVLTVIGLYTGYLLGGTIVIEEVFALPGMGRYVLNAIFQRDYSIVQGVVLFTAFLFVLVNLLVDILYVRLDPRITYEE